MGKNKRRKQGAKPKGGPMMWTAGDDEFDNMGIYSPDYYTKGGKVGLGPGSWSKATATNKRPSTFLFINAVDEQGADTSDEPLRPWGVHYALDQLKKVLKSLGKNKNYDEFLALPKALFDQYRIQIDDPKLAYAPQKRPLMCTYDAVKKYLKCLYGVELVSADEDFFIEHPLVEDTGVPMAHTLRVIQELIEPYGFRVSRVQMTPGVSARGDLRQWANVLGVNPLASTDHMTTNAEWYAQMEKDTAKYQFEYSAVGLAPAVQCTGGANGSGVGHASYRAPRERQPGEVQLSLQMRREHEVTWRRQPVFPAIEPPPIDPNAGKVWVFDAHAFLEMWELTHEEEVTTETPVVTAPKTGESTEPEVSSAIIPFSPTPALTEVQSRTRQSLLTLGADKIVTDHIVEHPRAAGLCQICGNDRSVGRPSGAPGVCSICWIAFSKASACCSKCEQEGVKPSLKFDSYAIWPKEIHVSCYRCKKQYTMNGRKYKFFSLLFAAIEADVHAHQDQSSRVI